MQRKSKKNDVMLDEFATNSLPYSFVETAICIVSSRIGTCGREFAIHTLKV